MESLSKVLKGIFEVIQIDKSAARYDVYLEEIRAKPKGDYYNKDLDGKKYTD